MASIFDKWNKNIDTEALVHDVEEAEQNGGGEYVEVPCGTYDVRVEKMELKESKNGNPMLSVWFKVLAGDYKGSFIFMNQVITQGFQIHIANEFLKSLETDLEVKFDGDYNNYNTLVMDIMESVDGNLEYALEYGENSKGYKTYKIVDVFDVD